MVSGVMIVIAVVIIVVFIAHKLLQEALDFVHIAISVIGVLLAIGLIAFVYDAISFRNSLSKQDSLVVLKDGNQVIHASLLKNSKTQPLTQDQLEQVEKSISSNDYGSALGKNYKLIIVNKDSLMRLSGQLNITSASFESDAFIDTLVKHLLSHPFSLIKEVRRGGIVVYPQTYTFKLVNYIPARVFGANATA